MSYPARFLKPCRSRMDLIFLQGNKDLAGLFFKMIIDLPIVFKTYKTNSSSKIAKLGLILRFRVLETTHNHANIQKLDKIFNLLAKGHSNEIQEAIFDRIFVRN